VKVGIIGAGAAGVRAAIELDNRNVDTILIEKEWYIGGKLTELSRIYPVCELYFAPQFFSQLLNSHNTEIITGAEVTDITKNNGYSITITKTPRVVTEKCTLCLECINVCEKNVVKKPPFFSVPLTVFIDREKCGDCTKCQEMCPENAITFDDTKKIIKRQVDHVIYATGAPLVNPEKYSEYGYVLYPDVITSIELEKMLHPSFNPVFVRPSDKKQPTKIAFLQCVGSRDHVKGNEYCSTVCCMQALNEAKTIKEQYPESVVSIFYIDMQCAGNQWEKFFATAQKQGVKCVRSRVSSVYEEEGVVYITYAADQLVCEEFDLAVLSVGIDPPDNDKEFFENGCGVLKHPVDITASVEDALAAVSGISGKKDSPSPLTINTDLKDGIQIFACTCGQKWDVPVTHYPVVVSDYLCREKGINKFLDTLNTKSVVIGACSTYKPLFHKLARDKGCKHIEVVNTKEKNKLHKQKMMEMAVAKVKHAHPVQSTVIQAVPKVVVIGGGVAGLTAALELNDYPVYIIEKEKHMGGRARDIPHSLTYSPHDIISELIKKVESDSNVHVLTETEIVACSGESGNFTVETNAGQTIECGAIVVAVGNNEYGHGYTHSKIITQDELEDYIQTHNIPNLVVMIQCVGSRNDEHPWCSSVCCSKAVDNSIRIKEQGAQVVVLYKDIRAYGFNNLYYAKAREQGVLFLQTDEYSIESNGDTVTVTYVDPVLDTEIIFKPDLVVLSTGAVPGPDIHEHAEILGIQKNVHGFFRGIHPKFYPVDSTREGIFVCGGCLSPKNVIESVTEAKAAASRVRTVLHEGCTVSEYITVDEDVCTGCASCVDVCPFGAISMVENKNKQGKENKENKKNTISNNKRKEINKKAVISAGMCTDCGLCVGCCPVGALTQLSLSDEQILHMVEVL
jgi:heterodisulfide reductase subunit A